MQTFNQLFFKKKQIFSYFFKEISDSIRSILSSSDLKWSSIYDPIFLYNILYTLFHKIRHCKYTLFHGISWGKTTLFNEFSGLKTTLF